MKKGQKQKACREDRNPEERTGSIKRGQEVLREDRKPEERTEIMKRGQKA